MHRIKSFDEIIFILLISLTGCKHNESEKISDMYESYCGQYLGTREDPCRISMQSILSNPRTFNEKYVKVSGYVSTGIDTFIFTSKDAANNSITSDSFILTGDEVKFSEIRNNSERYVTLTAQFINHPPRKSEFYRSPAKGSAGELRVDNLIKGTMIGIPYYCWNHKNTSEACGGK